MDEWKPVEEEEIPKRGKYRQEVKKTVKDFLKLVEEKGIEAIARDFRDRNLAMSYYDSFKDYIKKEDLPIEIRIRKINPAGKHRLFLIHQK